MAAVTWKLAKGKTWRGKLEQEHPSHGKIVAIPTRMQKQFGRGTMVIPNPRAMDVLMRKVRKGKLMTQGQLRAPIAEDCGADSACPMTTGIFLRIVAETAEEDLRGGKRRITPYWRTIKNNGALNDKYPGGVRAHAARLRAEGFTIARARGKQLPKVKDFERYLVSL